jgi:trehalose synthase-fused probable maltokinase
MTQPVMPTEMLLTVPDRWEQVCEGEGKAALESILLHVLATRRWFGGKGRTIRSVRIAETIPIPSRSKTAILFFLRVEYGDGMEETYLWPLTVASGVLADQIRREFPIAAVAGIRIRQGVRDDAGLLFDALWDPDVAQSLLEAMRQGLSFNGVAGTLKASSTGAYARLANGATGLDPDVMKWEQSNTSVAFGSRMILKLYRRLGSGVNPDLEIGRALTRTNFPYIPPVAGMLEYAKGSEEPVTLALLQGFVRNEGDAWRHSLEALNRFFMRIGEGDAPPAREAKPALLQLAREEYPKPARDLIGLYLQSAERLGQRTAELHLALSQVPGDPAFAPEPITAAYQNARYGAMIRLARQTLALLRERMASFHQARRAEACRLLELEPAIVRTFESFRSLRTSVPRIRCHGDYHLGQVLCTGSDFMIIDFEGEPARSLAERRMKHPAVLDVAGMVRSFHYAPFAFLNGRRDGVMIASGTPTLSSEAWARFWSDWSSAAFLKAYLVIAEGAHFWPRAEADAAILLEAYVLEKALYELMYELNNRPDWAIIPLRGLLEVLGNR